MRDNREIETEEEEDSDDMPLLKDDSEVEYAIGVVALVTIRALILK